MPPVWAEGMHVSPQGRKPYAAAARAPADRVYASRVPSAFSRLLCFLAAAVFSAHAGRIVPPDLQRLTQDSDAIVHGLVLSTHARWVNDARGRRIRTYATLRCHQWLKGPGGNEVVVELPGGIVGEVIPLIRRHPL